jgi:hypothetical protein
VTKIAYDNEIGAKKPRHEWERYLERYSFRLLLQIGEMLSEGSGHPFSFSLLR